MSDKSPTPTHVPTWEHRSILVTLGTARDLAATAEGEPLSVLDDALNTQALDGWELVSVIPALSAAHGAGGVERVLAIFRRRPPRPATSKTIRPIPSRRAGSAV